MSDSEGPVPAAASAGAAASVSRTHGHRDGRPTEPGCSESRVSRGVSESAASLSVTSRFNLKLTRRESAHSGGAWARARHESPPQGPGPGRPGRRGSRTLTVRVTSH